MKKTLVLILAIIEAGYMTFDGLKALFIDDYVTINGELGPWSKLVSLIGINPRSTSMKAFFAIYGLVWLTTSFLFVFKGERLNKYMMLAAAGALWYLPIGTLFSFLQIVLLKNSRKKARSS
jgi:hypothetical protein